MKKLATIIIGLAVGYTSLVDAQQKGLVKEIAIVESSIDKAASGSLTKEEVVLTKQWMLKETDWVKYKQIMQGPRGTWSPGLDPLTALGVSETDPVERQRYAEIWMKVEVRRAELEIAFEVERQRAAKKLLGDQKLVNNGPWIAEWEREQVAVRKQVIVFMDPSCKEECEEMFSEVRNSVKANARLDVYFVAGTTSTAIGEWAVFMKVNPSDVKAKKITLNYDEGRSKNYGVDSDTLPQVRVIDLNTGEVLKTFK